MKKLTKICLLSIAMFMSVSVEAQEKLPTLTKQQMQEDFDYFCKIIQDVNPQLTVRKKVTGVDILKNIKSLQSELDTIKQFENFYWLIEKALNLCHDIHATTSTPYETQKDINEKVIALNEQYSQLVPENNWWSWQTQASLKYYKGGYYFFAPLENSYNGEKTLFNVSGQGGNPAIFALPNSKITFRINAMLDYYGMRNAEDFFHNKITYPVKATVQEYSDFMLTGEERYSKEFLYNKDPMFKRVLEIK